MDISSQLNRLGYVNVLLYADLIANVFGIGTGFPIGFIIAFTKKLLVRILLLPVAIAMPISPIAVQFWHTSVVTLSTPLVWAVLAIWLYPIPILAFFASFLVGYQHGRERKLDRQWEDGA